ncbi:MAG: hypothetical protein H0X63_10600 [Flavobacteriales bacterium]|nr:hypothetical protein [Flavobacteriales bacterium]
MSYFGTVAHMLNSLKYNNLLLRKPKAFSKLKEHIYRQVEHNTKIHPKEIDPAELKKIKDEIVSMLRKERRRNNLISAIVIVISIVLFGLSINILFLKPKYHDEQQTKVLSAQVQINKEAEKNFYFYINDGYNWLKSNNYDSAIFQFKLAIESKPDNLDANIGLAKALLKKCYFTQENCEEANEQITLVIQKFSEESDVKLTISSYLMIIGDSVKANNILK